MKKSKRILSGLGSAAILINGAVAVAENETFSFTQAQGETVSYGAISNVQGVFSFDQEQLTPSDEVFNLFGTVLTGACAKPAFALENSRATYYINVGGKIEKSYSVNLGFMAEQKEQERTLLCACATGPATANVKVTGVAVEDILELSKPAEDVNAFTAVGSDGYGTTLPLRYVLEKGAMIAYKLNGENLPSGTQLWIPETVAKYFTRDVVDIVLSHEDFISEVEGRDPAYRAETVIMNYMDGASFKLGEQIDFEGYADDCGEAISQVEFSMDGGNTWTAYSTQGATADRWVYWHYQITPESAGEYMLSVRARTVNGTVSPLATNLVFSVTEDVGERI
ncbi:MAG: molybdopterin-dependent oxidoreductase [Clostridia bacterium]|nr:molybdopterin-dependent oxidoreductase [Clostridia bacterium]